MDKFKVGDKVSFVFENAEIVDFETDKPDSNIEVRLSTLGTYTIARKEVIDHKPAQPKLEVGQMWLGDDGSKRKILDIMGDRIFYRRKSHKGNCWDAHDWDVVSFKNDCAHKLITGEKE